MFKSGYVSVIGRPNVGKSSMLNDLIGEKISIISNKVQTTRKQIQLIYTDDKMQVIFLDTPGIQKPKNALGEYMLKVSEKSLEGIDLVVYVVDNSKNIGRLDSYIIEELKSIGDVPIILVINKMDLIESEEEKEELEKIYRDLNLFDQILFISALNGETKAVLDAIYEYLPEGPMYYPEYMLTDQSIRSISEEIIREKLLNLLREEVPHGINIEINEFKERQDKDIVDIDANIYVEKESHKGIVIGQSASMIKKVGIYARRDLEKFLEKKVNLKLFVKVSKDWRKNKASVKGFGYK